MAELVTYSSITNYLSGISTTYLTARSTCTAQSAASFYLGQQKVGSDYYCLRLALKFDTSSIGINSTVTGVTMQLGLQADLTATNDFNIQIVKYDWSASDPVSDINKDTVFDGILVGTLDDNILRNTSGISIDTYYTTAALNPAWLHKTGATYYGLRSDRDNAGITPTGTELVQMYGYGGTYQPVLTVTYIPGIATYRTHRGVNLKGRHGRRLVF